MFVLDVTTSSSVCLVFFHLSLCLARWGHEWCEVYGWKGRGMGEGVLCGVGTRMVWGEWVGKDGVWRKGVISGVGTRMVWVEVVQRTGYEGGVLCGTGTRMMWG